MSAKIRKALVDRVTEAAIDAAWTQWRSLGMLVTTGGRARSLVDPEALVLVSLSLRDRERRLWDVLTSWAKTGSTALSVQRTKNLQARYPAHTGERLAEFARIAFKNGGDHRWRKLAGKTAGPRTRDQKPRSTTAKGWDPAALMIRLRLGIGVGLHADILAFLLSQGGSWAPGRLIAQATGYSIYGIRRTADKMAEAQLIESTTEKPQEYRADTEVWGTVLGNASAVPQWRYWLHAYAFVSDLAWSAGEGSLEASSPYLLSTRLRDLADKHQDAFRLNQVQLPESASGEEYVAAFEETAELFANWMSRSV